MVQAFINNDPISLQMADGESVEVPDNEVWKITISGTSAGSGSSAGDTESIVRECKINGLAVASSVAKSDADTAYDNASASATTTFPFETVVVEGDEIKAENIGLQIGGFVVSE